MVLFHRYRIPALSAFQTAGLLAAAQHTVSPAIHGIETEFCFNIAADSPLTADEMRLLRWLLAETFEPEHFSDSSFLEFPRAPPSTKGDCRPRMFFSRSVPA